jgi:hypothetical protein
LPSVFGRKAVDVKVSPPSFNMATLFWKSQSAVGMADGGSGWVVFVADTACSGLKGVGGLAVDFLGGGVRGSRDCPNQWYRDPRPSCN